LIAFVFLALPQHVIQRRALALVTLASIISHLGFDVFAGDGQFPLLVPFDFQFYVLPYFLWPVLEVVALLTCIFAGAHNRIKPALE
jgi:hypothetical protein